MGILMVSFETHTRIRCEILPALTLAMLCCNDDPSDEAWTSEDRHDWSLLRHHLTEASGAAERLCVGYEAGKE